MTTSTAIMLAIALGVNFCAGLWCALDTLDRLKDEPMDFLNLSIAIARIAPPVLIGIAVLMLGNIIGA